ncbi:MAG: YjbH domain-containing protein [Bacteroidales bacterium]|nr:YjbH domain-containing protein [Bacteroidales bacterium]
MKKNSRKTITVKALVLLVLLPIALQMPKTLVAQKSKVDIFAGVDLKYRSIWLNDKMYELLINVTPGVKWRFGDCWQVTAQAFIPVVNDFGGYYKSARLNAAVVSKEFQAGSHYLKLSGGLFGGERFGVDAKWLWPVTSWFAMEGQLGFTGYYVLTTSNVEFSYMDRLTGLFTARFYLKGSDTEFRISGGRFNLGDYGGRIAWLKHFKHISVSAFIHGGNRYGEVYKMDGTYEEQRIAGGACIVVRLPFQGDRQHEKTLRVRPASNFRMTYDYMAEANALKMYVTDPEENERTGNFTKAKWGITR